MADLYEAFQSLFERLEHIERRGHSAARLRAADPGQIDALRALKDGLQQTAAALEAAVFDLQNSSQTNAELSRALSIANHCAAGAAQLLVAALDEQEEIRAVIEDMKACTEALGKIKTSTQELINDIGQVTGVVETAGKVLELIMS